MIFIISFIISLFLLENNKNWVELFNGNNLDGWEIKITGYKLGKNYRNTFKVQDGAIKVSYEDYKKFGGRFGHIFYTKNEFQNYVLSLDYKFSGEHLKGAPGWSIKNSGVMLHSQNPYTMLKNQEFPVSAEAQLLGGIGSGDRTTGNICTPGIDVDINNIKAENHCINSKSMTYDDKWVNIKIIVYSDSDSSCCRIRYCINLYQSRVGESNLRVGGEFIPKNYQNRVGESLNKGYISFVTVRGSSSCFQKY